VSRTAKPRQQTIQKDWAMQIRSNPSRLARALKIAWLPLCMLFVAACHADMYEQPRLEPYNASNFFPDGKAMQAPPANTVARGRLQTDEALYEGTENGEQVAAIPVEVTTDLVALGKQKYDIFCAICHGAQGAGNGIVAGPYAAGPLQAQPANLVEGELVGAPSGRIYSAIANGVLRGDQYSMLPYGYRVTPEQRWAIVAYIRALQQNAEAPLEVPADQLQ
jgi:mono/diheme cytochrome c family protein